MALNPAITEAVGMSENELSKRLIQDIRDVFTTMVGIDNLPHVPEQVGPQTQFSGSLTAMVGLAGSYNGLVSLHAPNQLAMRFTSGMLGMDVTEIDDDVRDAMGEITNMVAGSFKQHLSSGGADIKLSTPSVVTGDEYSVSAGSKLDSLIIRFTHEDEWFMVGVALEKE